MKADIWKHELRVPLITLLGASALGCSLVLARVLIVWRGLHLYLIGNLILAWIPLLLALRIETLERRGVTSGGHFWGTVIAWLLFFPNAPYIFTDLTHLTRATAQRWWTDLMIILLFAVTGLVLAFLSLHRMHVVVSRRRGRLAGWAFVLAVAFLSGFGVYLGRFERWNSWDVVVNPLGLISDSFNWLHRHTVKFTLLFGIFLSTAYALLYSVMAMGAARVTPVAPPPARPPDRSVGR